MIPKKDDPVDLFIETVLGGNPSSVIERSEKRGQDLLIGSEVLPIKINSGNIEQFKQMGIIYGENADDIFVYVTLPTGWKKIATDHNMWSILVDEKGRERASIFYKAAFYDRSAHINITRRYSYSVIPVCGFENENYKEFEWFCVVKDCNDIIWRSITIEPEPKFDREKREPWDRWIIKKDKLSVFGVEWLNEFYPDWENPTAYWDED